MKALVYKKKRAPEKIIIKKPAGITFDEAASFPKAASTALQALRNQGNIMKDMDVLLVGSSGGVGTFAIQLAHYFEANITAVCSSRNLEQASDLGAEKVIDYAREYFADNDRKYDIILAINGNYPIRDYRKCLKPDGTYVMVGGSFRQIFKSLIFGRLLSTGKRKMKSVTAKADRKDLEFLASLLEQKKIRAVIEKTYPFEQAAKAMEYVSKGHSSGKVVVRMV
jgi:NADPH:quinone reductase-like Zn-dependent oxidoreductase